MMLRGFGQDLTAADLNPPAPSKPSIPTPLLLIGALVLGFALLYAEVRVVRKAWKS